MGLNVVTAPLSHSASKGTSRFYAQVSSVFDIAEIGIVLLVG